MDVSEEEMCQVFKAVAGVLNCGNVKFRDVLDVDKTTEVVGVLDEQAEAAEYARCVRVECYWYYHSITINRWLLSYAWM